MATYFAQNLSDDLPLSRTDFGRLFQMAHSFGYARVCRGEILGDGGGKRHRARTLVCEVRWEG
jgi:hypothetical protein